MKYSQAKQGRGFVIRLEDGDIIDKELERFCKEKAIKDLDSLLLNENRCYF